MVKFSFSLKKQEATLEADVEKLIEKGMDQKTLNPHRKTRYQIRQEEKRKNREQKQKQQMQYLLIMLALVLLFTIIGIVASILGI